MAKSISRRSSAQEATIQQEETSLMESRFECPICIYWLNEPVLTSCGHRFCKKCITSWLKKQNTCCPIDNKPLTESDMFPDNFTRREILQMRNACPNYMHGCKINASPLEMDAHVLECSFRERTIMYDCPFKQCGCQFQTNIESSVDAHIQNETTTHLNMLMNTFMQNKVFDLKSIEASNLWDAPNKHSSNGEPKTTEHLLKSLYERIVVLEQQNQEKELKIEKLTNQLSKICQLSDVQARYSGGVLIWKIHQFHSKVNAMIADPNKMFYSNEAYTSPHGYKFCARINISPKVKDSIGLHVHLMQSENDFHLDWPFRGRIKISMIHEHLEETKHDTIMSKPEILAFHRPTQEISPRGFGYLEYASRNDILSKGFLIMDTLTLKIQLNIV